jgi:hypothetical protein
MSHKMTPREDLIFFIFYYLCPIWAPLPAKLQELVQNSEDTSEGLCVKTRTILCILGGILFM